MVVLEGGGALLEPALALDGAAAACLERAYAQADVSLKLLPKRYINLHQWLSPVTTSVTAAAAAGKDLKLQIRNVSLLTNLSNDSCQLLRHTSSLAVRGTICNHTLTKKHPRDVDCDIVYRGWAPRPAARAGLYEGRSASWPPPAFVMQIVAPAAAPRRALCFAPYLPQSP
ncbi:unnamed protein product [Diatraea saccharalis]|uniref:Uncharacterized protein n=1 Tax=Diatraea saccharalis TaxID=40085 RepID=A0A9N9N468_9NEOP|nr:unnamed protein product [Diatraea saccharalis]